MKRPSHEPISGRSTRDVTGYNCDATLPPPETPQNDPLRLWLRSTQPRPIQPGKEAQLHKPQLCHFELTEPPIRVVSVAVSRSAWLDRTRPNGRISLRSLEMSLGRPTNRLRYERRPRALLTP